MPKAKNTTLTPMPNINIGKNSSRMTVNKNNKADRC